MGCMDSLAELKDLCVGGDSLLRVWSRESSSKSVGGVMRIVLDYACIDLKGGLSRCEEQESI